MSIKAKVLILLVFILGFAYSEFNETSEIRVIEYSIWLADLPSWSSSAVNNWFHERLHAPREIDALLENAGFVTLILIVAIIMILVIIGYAVKQICFQGICCREVTVGQDICQRISGKVLSSLVFFSIVIACSVGIFYFSRYYYSVWGGMDTTKSIVLDTRETVLEIKGLISNINQALFSSNITAPVLIDRMEKATSEFKNYLTSAESESARALEQWAPVTVFILLTIFAIAGLLAVYSGKRWIFIIVSFFIGVLFIIVLVCTIAFSVISIILSDYCVMGVDNNTLLVINAFIDDPCTEDAMRYYIFCKFDNQSCNPYPKFINELSRHHFNLDDLIKSNPSHPNYTEWIRNRDIIEQTQRKIYEISDCKSTHRTFIRVTQVFCGDAAPSVALFTTMFELITGLIFIFLIVAVTYNPEAITLKEDDVDLEMSKKKGGRRRGGLKPAKDMKKKQKKLGKCPCTTNCLSCFLVLIILWALMVFITFIVVTAGSKGTTVPRLYHPPQF